MLFLNAFRQDPFLPEIEDDKKVKSMYAYWRMRIFYSMFIGYALYYFTRKSFIFAQPGLIEDLHFTKGQLGYISSIFSITYGLSKFVSGIIADRSNPRYFMAFGLFMTGVANIIFGLGSSFIFFAVFWAMNAWFQGFGWPPCARYLTYWYSQSERGSWWSTWNVSHNVGAFLIPWVVGGSLQYLDWRYAMYIPGVICILGSLFLINRLRDTPQSLGLPPIEKFRNDWVGSSKEEVETEYELTTKEILVDHVLKSPYIWLLAISYFFVYVVRTGINDWSAIYLIEEKNYSKLGANGTVSLFEVGGFIGSLAAGWSSDYLFRAMRGPVNVLFSIFVLLAILLFWFSPSSIPYVDSIAIFFLGVTIFGPQMLIGVHAAELAHKKAAATSTGFIGLMAYIGAASAGGPLGTLIENHGWNYFFISMVACSVVSILFLLPLWGVKETKFKR